MIALGSASITRRFSVSGVRTTGSLAGARSRRLLAGEARHPSRTELNNSREVKPPRTPVAITPSGELTCSEGQVEDLLSEGESTEKETPNLRKQPEQKPFPRNIPQVIMPARKWK